MRSNLLNALLLAWCVFLLPTTGAKADVDVSKTKAYELAESFIAIDIAKKIAGQESAKTILNECRNVPAIVETLKRAPGACESGLRGVLDEIDLSYDTEYQGVITVVATEFDKRLDPETVEFGIETYQSPLMMKVRSSSLQSIDFSILREKSTLTGEVPILTVDDLTKIIEPIANEFSTSLHAADDEAINKLTANPQWKKLYAGIQDITPIYLQEVNKVSPRIRLRLQQRFASDFDAYVKNHTQ